MCHDRRICACDHVIPIPLSAFFQGQGRRCGDPCATFFAAPPRCFKDLRSNQLKVFYHGKIAEPAVFYNLNLNFLYNLAVFCKPFKLACKAVITLCRRKGIPSCLPSRIPSCLPLPFIYCANMAVSLCLKISLNIFSRRSMLNLMFYFYIK